MERWLSAQTAAWRWALLAAAYPLAIGATIFALANGFPVDLTIITSVGNVAFLIAGTIALVRRPANLIGPLMLAAGCTGFLVGLVLAPHPALVWLGNVMGGLTNTFLVWVVLASPAGRLANPGDRVALVVMTLAFVGFAALDIPELRALSAPLGLLFALILAVSIGRRWVSASRPARQALAPVVFAGLATSAVFASASAAQLAGIPSGPGTVTFAADGVARALVPFGFLAGILRLRTVRAAVADLVIDLSEHRAERIRDALATALGDPSIDVVYWSPAFRTYLDQSGVPVELPGEAGDRSVTLIEHAHRPFAAILHDPALAEDPGLVAAVAAAVRMAVDNDRLTGEVHRQLDEVKASRTRIVEAADAERRRVERNLHDGAQQRLVALSLALRRAETRASALGDGDADPDLASSLATARDQVRAAIDELRDLARGIHPAVLTEAGLAAALRSLAQDAAVPVALKLDIPEGLAPPIEAAAYFVAAEGLANVAKYAEATRATVSAEADGDHLRIEVADDGRGGADPAAGSGLRGLMDRVAAVDGRLEVRSPVGEGTRLVARLPIAGSAGASS